MHEIGHNIGLLHSNENGQSYDDQSCLMGYSYTSNEGPKMCFNGAKSWLLGWYQDKSVSVDLDVNDQSQNTWNGKLVGVTDYSDQLSAPEYSVVVEIVNGDQADNNIQNYYLLYNRKDGVNSGVPEHGDKVTITGAKLSQTASSLRETEESEHLAHLQVGQTYQITNFKGSGLTLIIKYCESNTSNDPEYARVSMYFSNDTDQCTISPPPPSPPTPPSTPNPTRNPTRNPTPNPTSPPPPTPNPANPPPPTPNPTNCPSGQFSFLLQLQTDNFGYETRWNFKSTTSRTVVAKSDNPLSNNELYEHDLCLDDGCYDFKITDSWNDGICCEYGEGYYKGYLYGNTANEATFEGGQFTSSSNHRFCGTSSPTPPTSSPTQSPTDPNCSSDQTNIEVNLLTDRFPLETQFSLVGPTNVKVFDENGPWDQSTQYTYDGCFQTGCYTFEINDSAGDGLCCGFGVGNFEVKVQGETVLQGGDFGSRYRKKFCACGAGEKYFQFDLNPDNYPSETSWELKSSNNNVLLSGKAAGESGCIPDDCYTLYLYDTFGDGICCQYGSGNFRIKYDNDLIDTGGEFQDVYSKTFGNLCSNMASESTPTPPLMDTSYEKDEFGDTMEKEESEGSFGCLLKGISRLFQ